jgi:hypothetical protein
MLASSRIRSTRLSSLGSIGFVMVASVETPTTISASRSHRRQTVKKGRLLLSYPVDTNADGLRDTFSKMRSMVTAIPLIEMPNASRRSTMRVPSPENSEPEHEVGSLQCFLSPNLCFGWLFHIFYWVTMTRSLFAKHGLHHANDLSNATYFHPRPLARYGLGRPRLRDAAPEWCLPQIEAYC